MDSFIGWSLVIIGWCAIVGMIAVNNMVSQEQYMYIDVKYRFRPNPKCNVEVVRYVETMYSFREVKSKCGQTDVDGGRVLCDACCEMADNMERANGY